MAGSSNDTTSINPANSGFPPYLDFTTMRSNAINYLGPITGKYWTDYNVHDPGITTLEVLIYALMDLGYRVNLPIGNLLAGSTFFTPGQVFGCNPASVIDYRKLLMDLDEVRNAWLEPDGSDINGLYVVYLETEKDETYFTTAGQWEKYKHAVHTKVRETLHAYRNLCEDVSRIVFLRKVYIGVNADIEIVPGTSVTDTYQAVVQALYSFFLPVPAFYTLAQLTAMNISLDRVFEGRPYTGRPSHGFLLDAEMPERPSGEQIIYRSAVIQTMLGVSGIKTVRSLALLDAQKDPLHAGGGKWVVRFGDDVIPAFSLAASTFRWYQNGQQLSVQVNSYNSVLQLNALHSGKVIYPAGSPALDIPPPDETPLKGLGNYYSVQNEYPQVYGIGPGGLPPASSVLRQSQALQFKGYLLFFDQLLADYLAQLSNVRELFTMSGSTGGRSYFGGDLGTVPDLDRLLRFPPGPGAGATLLNPVAAADWQAASNLSARIESLAPYMFASALERDTALATLTVLFASGQLTVASCQLDNGLWKYYLTGIPGDYILMSQNSFITREGAMGEAQTVLYTGASKYNYSLVSLGEVSEYTFGLVQSGSAYFNYLETILEDPAKYTGRRTGFLEHLLSRFAEAFTDYALLEAGFASDATIAGNRLGLMQQFLGGWPALSADRGKAFDYRLDGWNSKNTSGLEKRFKAYCGIADERRHYLCNFEVSRMEERFYVSMRLGGEELFTCTETIGEREAVPAVFSLFASLADGGNYRVAYRSGEAKYCIETLFRGQLIARGAGGWPDEASARQAADTLCRMWQLGPGKGDSQVSEYQYRPQLLDNQGRSVRTGVAGFIGEREALEHGMNSLRTIDEEAVWVPDEPGAIGDLCINLHPQMPPDRFIDISGFKIYLRQDVLGAGKSSRWSFEVLDEDNSFRFRSTLDFGTETAARDACCQLLHFLTETRYYTIKKGPGDWSTILIRVGDDEWAEAEPGWETEAHARERIPLIALQVRQKLYTLRVVSKPYRWKYLFYLGIPGRGSMTFESIDSFETQHASQAAARIFHEAGPGWKRREEGSAIFLEGLGPDGARLVCRLMAVSRPVSCAEPVAVTLGYLLEAKEAIYRLAAGDEELAREMIVPDETSREGAFIYRLVDKDHPLAFHHALRDKVEAEEDRERLIEKGREGYVYLEICLGGDNVRPGYRYVLRSRNDYFSRTGVGADDVVLFESAQSFADEDTAQAAFQQNYLHILDMARDPENYGEGKYIGQQVLIPAGTKDLFRRLGLDEIEELVKAARTYPIRLHKDRYKFVMAGGGHLDWESAIDYATATEAHLGFDFFRLLLDFPGNYFIEFNWKECHYRVGLREVLAESTHRYHNEDAAWGPNGVEKFICVAQSAGTIHLNRRADCTYGYFFACPNRHAVHPCEYETAAQRDRAMHRLMQEAGHFIADGWIDLLDDHHFRLLDGRGRAIAIVPRVPAILDRILDIADAIWAGSQPERFGSGMQLLIGEGSEEFAIDPPHHWNEAEWMRKLTDFAAYFPIVRESSRNGYIYRLEVKLPGFVDPPVPAPSPKDCGCPPVPEGEPPYCYLAWKSERHFENAAAAWEAWLALLPLLADKENYRPVFAEEIGRYGIGLHEKKDVIARNPQFYTYAAMAVESVGRAKTCIDAEGLDLVEHLLLRPAISGAAIPVCETAGPCTSVWSGDGDPYSFIVTIALPAWPARFRKKQNRVMLESILQREMPAHILARILWLTPKDMCRFEFLYAGWIDALSRGERVCTEFKPAEFIKWLFGVKHGCLAECRECGRDEEDNAGITAREEEWLDQINRLYCWRDSECAEEWAGLQPAAAAPDPRRIRRLQSDRRKRYEQKIAEWRELTGEEKPAEVVSALLLDPNPSTKRLEDVLKEIMKGGRKRGAKATHRQRLAEITLSIYLDRITMEGDNDRWTHLRTTLEKFQVTIENASALYREWQPDEMRQLAPGLDAERIQNLLRERQKREE